MLPPGILASSMIFFKGDTHFGGSGVLRIDQRSFPDMTEHEAAVVRNWNAVFGMDDDVSRLGDLVSAESATAPSCSPP